MIEKFLASNGIEIMNTASGQFEYRTSGEDGFGIINPEYVVAFSEYFQSERDAELGRWRSRQNPDFVVYPVDWQDGHVYSIDIVDEKECMTRSLDRDSIKGTRDSHTWKGTRVSHTWWSVAREYFRAHPVQKPWESAELGSFWRITAKECLNVQGMSFEGTLSEFDGVNFRILIGERSDAFVSPEKISEAKLVMNRYGSTPEGQTI